MKLIYGESGLCMKSPFDLVFFGVVGNCRFLDLVKKYIGWIWGYIWGCSLIYTPYILFFCSLNINKKQSTDYLQKIHDFLVKWACNSWVILWQLSLEWNEAHPHFHFHFEKQPKKIIIKLKKNTFAGVCNLVSGRYDQSLGIK